MKSVNKNSMKIHTSLPQNETLIRIDSFCHASHSTFNISKYSNIAVLKNNFSENMIGSEEYTRDFIPRILNMYSFKSEVTVLLWMRGRKLSWCSSKNSTSYSLRVYWVRAVAIFILIGRRCVRTEGQNQIKVFDLPTSWFTFAEHIPNLPIYNHQINEQRHRKKLTWSQWSPVYICIYLSFCLCSLYI